MWDEFWQIVILGSWCKWSMSNCFCCELVFVMILQYKVTIKVFYSLSSNNLKPHNKYQKSIFCYQRIERFPSKKIQICNRYSPNFLNDVSFHVSFHVKFGYMGCCDFSINNPQNTCLVTWLLTWNITFWVKYSVKKSGDWINTGKSRLNF